MAKTIFWFRRDLRLEDNAALFHALQEKQVVQPLFIFDSVILDKLEKPFDSRVVFIHRRLAHLKDTLNKMGSDLQVQYGDPVEIFKKLMSSNEIAAIYANHDYEPYARARDKKVAELCLERGVQFKTFKDQLIFEKDQVFTDSGKPYTVYTPYKKKWLSLLKPEHLKPYDTAAHFASLVKAKPERMISLSEMGFEERDFPFPRTALQKEMLENYKDRRDFPEFESATSRLGLHLRFGTVSVRDLVSKSIKISDVWLSELIWREFFMQILWHNPRVEHESFRPIYDKIAWRENEKEFSLWKQGKTGFPLVDAGMRELNETGHMHNRVRMVVASFLTKHLLMHWLKGERYFAAKLLDYDLSANNGNWQWAAGSGCDAAPYFRVFNPETQLSKFDPDLKYVKRWVPEFGGINYAKPMVDHKMARERALREFTKVLKG